MKEADIQRKILLYLASVEAWTVKTVTSNKKGVPDIIACVKGIFVGIEVKRPGKKPTPLQRVQGKLIGEAGGVFTVAYSVEDVKNAIKHLL